MYLRGSIAILMAAASWWALQLSAQEIGPTECTQQCEYLSRIAPDYSIQVIPSVRHSASKEAFSPPALDSAKRGWTLVARWRLDEPAPFPPPVPIGAAGLAWAVDNPSDFWRVIMPIPPEQTPQLTLAAEPRTQRLRSILSGSTPTRSAESKATVIVTSQAD